MIVIATGPRGSGTSLLYKILRTGDLLPFHVPAYVPWVEGLPWEQLPDDALFVAIDRKPELAVRSLVFRGFASMDEALAEQREARRYIETLPPERMFRLAYDQLVEHAEMQVARLGGFLRGHGYTGPDLTIPEPIVDADAKYRGAA